MLSLSQEDYTPSNSSKRKKRLNRSQGIFRINTVAGVDQKCDDNNNNALDENYSSDNSLDPEDVPPPGRRRYLLFGLDRRRRASSVSTALSSVVSTDSFATSISLGPLFTINNNMDVSFAKASIKDYKKIAKTLSLAFELDPFVNYVLHTKTRDKSIRKKRLFQSYFEWNVFECFKTGGTIIILKDANWENLSKDMPYLGVACWYKLKYDATKNTFLNASTLSFLSLLHPIMLKFNLFYNSKHHTFLSEKFEYLIKQRTKVLEGLKIEDPENHSIWYLGDLGVLPMMQGKGLARKLIEFAFENFVDTKPNQWVYLESSNPINRVFYQKLGFELRTTYDITEEEDDNFESSSFSSAASSNVTNHSTKAALEVTLDGMIKYPKLLKNIEATKTLFAPITTAMEQLSMCASIGKQVITR
ncbi:uncharacterized protein KQ657_000700 [Scheffersomyces spartinae]|uniref:N-acetyltransferase domain-containing protein n=1 Tax=Scheffersomyces spartinae TaxID=45513 RepID=A0A9P7V932_9ASCO|nr:uncharacterized protein KQ657_000700 [Scheffersomyces spartinae]KAG7193627.1 hypothetical protein KQ657_000700 [Scheffersomyces spartinae]